MAGQNRSVSTVPIRESAVMRAHKLQRFGHAYGIKFERIAVIGPVSPDSYTSGSCKAWTSTLQLKIAGVQIARIDVGHSMRWRERAIREVRDELDRFLNYPMVQDIKLGQYGTYDGKKCRFEWEGNLSDLGIEPASAGFQHEMAETYATSGKVNIQSRLSLDGQHPAVDVTFARTSALAFRGFKIGYSQVQLSSLSTALSEAIRKGLQWDRKKVIITQIWQAGGFTHLVAGGAQAKVEIEATAKGSVPTFNFADPSLDLNVVAERSMSYCAVGQSQVEPYFNVHRLREIDVGVWQLYKYGLR